MTKKILVVKDLNLRKVIAKSNRKNLRKDFFELLKRAANYKIEKITKN